MAKTKLLFLFIAIIGIVVIVGCNSDSVVIDDPIVKDTTYIPDTTKLSGTNILMLIVDYTTNEFVGGKELHFDSTHPSFTITTQYKSPGDFGWIKLYYSEIDELIFWGGIIWHGCGKIEFPTDILMEKDFKISPNDNIEYPVNGFEPVFPVDTHWVNYYPNSTIENAWLSIQGRVKTREYLSAEKVKVYEWQPSVGVGNIADRKWIFFLKKSSNSNL